VTHRSDPKESPWFTTAQAAHYLGLHPGTLRRWRIDATGPTAHRAGRAVRYHRDDLDTYLLKAA
jgi:excisionase family DNA binding protein